MPMNSMYRIINGADEVNSNVLSESAKKAVLLQCCSERVGVISAESDDRCGIETEFWTHKH